MTDTTIAQLSARHAFGGPYQPTIWEVLGLDAVAALYNQPLPRRQALWYEELCRQHRLDHPLVDQWHPLGLEPVEWPDPGETNGGFTKAGWDAWNREHPRRCRDCGTTAKLNQGGTDGPDGPGQGFLLCDGCAAIDQCRVQDGRHFSHWGMCHLDEECADLFGERERRRQSHLRAHPTEPQEALF